MGMQGDCGCGSSDKKDKSVTKTGDENRTKKESGTGKTKSF